MPELLRPPDEVTKSCVMSDSSTEETDRSEPPASTNSAAWAWVLGVLGIYVGVFVLLILDEVVFRTYLVSRRFPNLATPARILFFPLLWIAHRLGFLPMPPVF